MWIEHNVPSDSHEAKSCGNWNRGQYEGQWSVNLQTTKLKKRRNGGILVYDLKNKLTYIRLWC